MNPCRDTPPRRPLDDDWLFCDPMTIDLTGRLDMEPDPPVAAVGRDRAARWRVRLLAAGLIFAAGTLAGALLAGSGQDRSGVTAATCPQAPGERAAVAGTVSQRSG